MTDVPQDPRECGSLSEVARPPGGMMERQTRRADSPGTQDSNESPGHGFNLNDLPNEIVLHILGGMQDDELCGLALLSRRMNHLALPIYLARRSFGPRQNDRLVLFDYNSRDVLRALNPALFKTSLTRLHYPLDSEKPPDELGRELRGLRDLIHHHLLSLREATIDFQNTTPLALSFFVSPTSRLWDIIPTYGVPNPLQGDLVALLDVIIASGCKSLRISHCGSQIPAVQNINTSIFEDFGRPPWLVKTRYLRPFLSLFGTSGAKAERNDLKTFYLHSSMAFHPHLSRWTIEALNNSHITTLSISQQQCTDEDSWALILPYIIIPTLTHLSFDSCTMRLCDVVKFLSRHNGVQTLYLGRGFALSASDSTPSNIILGQLSHISAPTHTIVHFLNLEGQISTPALSSVTILLRVSHAQHFHLGMLDDPLQSAFFRLKAVKELHLALSFVSIPTTWIVTRIGPTATRPNANKVHSLVTHLDIDVKVYSLPLFPLTTHLPEMLTRFPNLRHLRILTMSNNEPPTQLQKNIATRVMMNHCPQLDSVDFAAVEEVQ